MNETNDIYQPQFYFVFSAKLQMWLKCIPAERQHVNIVILSLCDISI